MFKNWYFVGNKWEMAKIIMVAVCIILIVNQISAGIQMIKSNENLPELLSQENFDTLTVGTEIRGELTHIDGTMYGNDDSGEGEIQYYIMTTSSQKILLIRTLTGTETDKEIRNMMRGDRKSVDFRGFVRQLSYADRSSLNLELIASNYLKKHNIKSGTHDAMLDCIIDITEADSKIPDKYIIFTFVTAGLLVLLIPLLLRKTIKNAYISWAIRKGKIIEEKPLDKKDYIFENDGLYETDTKQGDSFFVNTKHNVRDEGAVDEGNEDLLTHMTAQEDLFYEGGLNDEGNFYIDSSLKNQTLYSKDPNDENYLKKY